MFQFHSLSTDKHNSLNELLSFGAAASSDPYGSIKITSNDRLLYRYEVLYQT